MITTVGRGEYTYEWNSNWAQIPDFVDFKQQDGALNGRTHAVTVAKDGRVFIFNQSNYAILIFNPDGSYAGTWDEFPSSHFEGAHGLTRHEEGGREFLWLTDEYSSEVVKTTLDGEIVLSIERPTGGVYADADAPFLPTWAAQAEDGTIFVSDGYGSRHISRYDKDGNYIDSFGGDTDKPCAGKFFGVHCIWIGRRPQATGTNHQVIYVTDRANHRVEVFDLNWNFVKSFLQLFPCCFDMDRPVNCSCQTHSPISRSTMRRTSRLRRLARTSLSLIPRGGRTSIRRLSATASSIAPTAAALMRRAIFTS